MRELTAEEMQVRDRRRAAFDKFVNERMPVLHEFASLLQLRNPALILAEPDTYLPAIDTYLKEQTVKPEHRSWIGSCVGYLIGEVLVSRLGGHWFLNEIPDSGTFLRYVVGEFLRGADAGMTVDSFEAADKFLSQPPPRDLIGFIAEIERAARAGRRT